jgi:hypothetical protein
MILIPMTRAARHDLAHKIHCGSLNVTVSNFLRLTCNLCQAGEYSNDQKLIIRVSHPNHIKQLRHVKKLFHDCLAKPG